MENINILSGYEPTENSINVKPSQIAEIYSNVIRKFINRTDVQNGKAIAYKRWNSDEATFEDTPKSIGYGLSTTGWCVSASSALLNDPIFQETLTYRKAKAKLVSIDIQERWYGHCYNGTQNKWHTAILLNDSGVNLIIDITCSQFSPDFIKKWVWDFKTWETTFRSRYDKHIITDCEDKTLSASPLNEFVIDNKKDVSLQYSKIFDKLHDCINLTDYERRLLTEYFLYNNNIINDKIICENLTQNDYDYLNQIYNLLYKMPFTKLQNGICILKFKTKQNLKNWLKKLLEENKIPQNLFVSESLNSACDLLKIKDNELNKKSEPNCKWYLVINFENIYGINSEFIENTNVYLPVFTNVDIDLESIQNSGKRVMEQNPTNGVFDKETNTIYVTIKSNK